MSFSSRRPSFAKLTYFLINTFGAQNYDLSLVSHEL